METPNDREQLLQAYPRVNWDKPFDEFHAAKEKPDSPMKRGVNV